jgi:hypothetical protein
MPFDVFPYHANWDANYFAGGRFVAFAAMLIRARKTSLHSSNFTAPAGRVLTLRRALFIDKHI